MDWIEREAYLGAESLLDTQGRRKYLCASEVEKFSDVAARASPRTRALCRLLLITGCRISEALAVTQRDLDPSAGCVVFQTLKRRRRAFRSVPVPYSLMAELVGLGSPEPPERRLWPWSRQTGWRHIKSIFREAAISGPQASPKGLRHSFGIRAAAERIPPSMTQRWMGHASSKSTAIYQYAVGEEERALAQRMWTGRAD